MYVAVDFQNQSMLDAKEINHVAVYHMLPPELESEQSAITQDVPRTRFRFGGALPKDSRTVALEEGNPSTSRHAEKIGNLPMAGSP